MPNNYLVSPMRPARCSNDSRKPLVLLKSRHITAVKEPRKLIMCGIGGAGNYRTFFHSRLRHSGRQTSNESKFKADSENTEPYKTNPSIARILRRLQMIRFARTRGHQLLDDDSDWDEKEWLRR
jgi:hypothetical protein